MTVRRGGEQARSERAASLRPLETRFTTFGIAPFAGRMLTDADDTAGSAPVAVLSYQAWLSDFAADPSILGATIYLQSKPLTVVGIAPPGFYGDRRSPAARPRSGFRWHWSR